MSVCVLRFQVWYADSPSAERGVHGFIFDWQRPTLRALPPWPFAFLRFALTRAYRYYIIAQPNHALTQFWHLE